MLQARPCASVTPAAMACPPPFISSPSATARRTACPRSTPAIERPDPVPYSPGSSAMAKAGRPYRSLSRRCDEADHAGMPAFRRRDHHRALLLDAERRHRLGFRLGERRLLDRLPFTVEAVEFGREPGAFGRIVARAGADARASARPMRPPALMRGPEHETEMPWLGRPASRATSISAVSPTFSRRRIAISPLATNARLRPRSGTTSATVPSATRSSCPSRSGSGRCGGPEAARAQRTVDRDDRHEDQTDRGQMAELGEIVEPVRD